MKNFNADRIFAHLGILTLVWIIYDTIRNFLYDETEIIYGPDYVWARIRINMEPYIEHGHLKTRNGPENGHLVTISMYGSL